MKQTKPYDIAIIGGGLAGLSLAIQCAAQNRSVLLFEKEAYPFHKVCGEYISMESKPFLESLGVPFAEMQLPEIHQLKLTDTKGHAYHFPLPLGGFGISRYKLDEMLYQIALQKGVTFFTGTKVTDVSFANESFTITSSTGVFSSKVAAGAWGKRSNMDLKWKRDFAQQKANKLNNYVGIKYHIRHAHPPDEIVLHNFKNGYCGMSKIEDDKSCLCYLTTAENLRQCNNSVALMEQQILFKNPHLKEVFTNATFLYEQPVTISQISFSKKQQVENSVLMLGDTAGMITPLCGNGMSMALHSSKLAFQVIESFLRSEINRQQMEAEYTNPWQQTFATRLKVGRLVQRLFGGETTTFFFLKTMNAMPWLSKQIIRSTHGEAF